MKLIIEKLLALLRTLLSRIGFSAGPASPSGGPVVGSGRAEPPHPIGVPEQDAAPGRRPQATGPGLDQAAQEPGGGEAEEAPRSRSGAEAGPHSAASAPAEEPDAAEEEASSGPAPEALMEEPVPPPIQPPVGIDEGAAEASDAESAVGPGAADGGQQIRIKEPPGGKAARPAEGAPREPKASGRSPLDQEPQKPKAEKPSGPVRPGTKRRPPRPAPAEEAGEYVAVVQDVSAVDRDYARWNSAVVEQLLLAKPSSEYVYLCVNPRILAWAFAEAGFDVLAPEQAEQRFSEAAAVFYRKRVLEGSARLDILRRCGDDGSPDCAAFLAASVLAAYHMQSDEEASGRAYYKRLADLLWCMMSGPLPDGFSTPAFESLWVFLDNWLREAHGRRLAMPGAGVGLRRFVALPLAHVPLRSLDIERLPAFFAWAGYEPGGRVRRDRLLADLRRWQQARGGLTSTGAGALADDRSDAVLAQVSAELESWDGGVLESTSSRSALVEIQFDVVQRSPELRFLPRRPPGFPGVFDDGEHVFEASDEGWYDPSPIHSADGELLASGFEWRSQSGGAHYTLRRSEALVIALAPSSNYSYSGFLSSRRLPRNFPCSVLCRGEVAGRVEEYLSEAARQRLNAVHHPKLPNGWLIIRELKLRDHVEAPPGLEALEIDPNIEFIPSGGLRIGRRWSWTAGAPPRILVSGVEEGDTVKVNGASVEVGGGGELHVGRLLARPGVYLLEAGRSRRRIEVVDPQVSIRGPAERSTRGVMVPLPQGSWTLIGRSPDQVCSSHGGFFRGTLALCSFRPVWAVQVGAGPGARVAALAKPEPPKEVELRRLEPSSRSIPARWAAVVYNAHVRRPSFLRLNGMAPDDEIAPTWRQYAAAARKIKRALKRA